MKTKKIISRFYLFQFLSGLHLFSAVLRPFFVDWGGVNMAVAQGLQSWFMFCVFVLEVPTGVVADIIGRRKSLMVGSLVSVLATLVYGSYPNIYLFFFAEFLFAVGVAFISGADRALLYDTLTKSGQQASARSIFGKSKSAHLLGIAASGVLGAVAAKYIGINAPMLLTSIPMLLAAFVAYTLPETKDSGRVVEERSFVKTLKLGFAPLKESRLLRRWTINATIVASAAYFVIWLYQPLMWQLKIPLMYYGFAHSGLVVVEIIIAANFERLVRICGSQKKYLTVTSWLVALSMLLAAIYPSVITLCALLVFAGGFGLTRLELMTAQMNSLIASGSRATTLSAISMVNRISIALVNPFVGFLTDRSISYSLFAVCLLPLATLLFPIKKEDPD